MAISTYAELQTAIGNWLGRLGDATIAAIVPDWIALCELRFNRERLIRATEKRQLLVEYALVAKQQASSGVVADLTTP